MTRPKTSVRIELLLAIIPWVTERGGATVGDIAERFGMQPDAVYDLLFSAMCYEVVGAGGYETLGIVVFGEDDDAQRAWVHVEPGVLLDRPLDLSAPQAFGILVAGQSALALRGADPAGPLATALEKLRSAYGERIQVSVDLPRPRFLAVLQAALRSGTTVAIRYYTPHSDAISERSVDPLAVSLLDGHWYLQGWCHLRQDFRLFRVDRIEECTETDELHGRTPETPESVLAAPAESDETTDVVLSIPRSDLWRVESFPFREVRAEGDRCIVTYALRSPWVLGQMLLRLGAESQVVNAADLSPEYANAGRSVAAGILEMYGA